MEYNKENEKIYIGNLYKEEKMKKLNKKNMYSRGYIKNIGDIHVINK